MREYGKIGPVFWTRGSGKRLRGDALGQAIASYLCTCPHANMIGLYYVAIPTIVHETGHSAEDVRAALKRIEAAGFAFYDEEHEIVFVPNGAAFQIGDTLKAADKRLDAIVKELRSVGSHRFVKMFLDLYEEAYCLSTKVIRHNLDAPSRAQEGGPARAGASAPAPAPGSVSDLDPDLGDKEQAARHRTPGGDVSGVHRVAAPSLGTRAPIPPDLPLTADARSGAETMGVRDVDLEWTKFVAHHVKTGDLSDERGWYLGAWRKWCATAKQFQSADRMRLAARSATGTPVVVAPSADIRAGGPIGAPDAHRDLADARRSYEAGAARGLGRPYAVPEKQIPELQQVLTVHAAEADDPNDWIGWHAEEFTRWVLALPAPEHRFWSSFGPKGLLRWLNEVPAIPDGDARAGPQRARGPSEPARSGANAFLPKGVSNVR